MAAYETGARITEPEETGELAQSNICLQRGLASSGLIDS